MSQGVLVFALGFGWGGFIDILSISAVLSQHAPRVGRTGGEPGSVCSGPKIVKSRERRIESMKSCKGARKNIRTANNFFRELCARMN